jgi:hypothetical protein
MNEAMSLETLVASPGKPRVRQLDLFALLGLGIIESLTSGLLSPPDALRVFFNAENCLFVRRRLRAKAADEFMSRGGQLADLFDALPKQRADREFQRELETMRSLCLKLLKAKRRVA